MIAIFWVYISGYQLDVRLSSLLDGLFANYFSLKSLALRLTDLWNTSLLFDLNYKFELMGASLLALAKSIY